MAKNMSKKYAIDMWKKYLELLKLTDENRITNNPCVEFTENVKVGIYDSLDEEEYDSLLSNVEQEGALYGNKRRSSACTIFLRGYRCLSLTDRELERIAEILADASLRVDDRKEKLQ